MVGCRPSRSSGRIRPRPTRHEARHPSPSSVACRGHVVRSAALCLSRRVTQSSIDRPHPATRPWPITCASLAGSRLARSCESVESRTRSRSGSLTIPIGCGGVATRLRPTGFIRTEPALVTTSNIGGSADETLFVRHRPMSSRGNWTRRLGAISCFAAVIAGLIYAGLVSSKGPHLNWTFALFGVAAVGLVAGLAGLISSRGQGRVPILSLVGCVLSLPSAFVGLMGVAVIFGQRH